MKFFGNINFSVMSLDELESIYHDMEPIPKWSSENFFFWALGTWLWSVTLVSEDDSVAGSDTGWALVLNNTWGEGGAEKTEILCGFLGVFTMMIAFFLSFWVQTLSVKWKSPVSIIRVPSLGREDPLEKEMTTHSSILAWRIPQAEEPGGLQSIGSQRVTEVT